MDKVAFAHALGQSFPAADNVALIQGNMLWKWHNGEWVGKPALQTKSLRWKWVEEALPEEIDPRYNRPDGSRLI